jgi:hypothetical protein
VKSLKDFFKKDVEPNHAHVPQEQLISDLDQHFQGLGFSRVRGTGDPSELHHWIHAPNGYITSPQLKATQDHLRSLGFTSFVSAGPSFPDKPGSHGWVHLHPSGAVVSTNHHDYSYIPKRTK